MKCLSISSRFTAYFTQRNVDLTLHYLTFQSINWFKTDMGGLLGLSVATFGMRLFFGFEALGSLLQKLGVRFWVYLF